MFYVYVLRNPRGILYKGSTGDLPGRIEEHNWGILKKYTKNKGPWQLVYFEQFTTRAAAMRKERFFKTGKGREYLKTKL